MVRKYLFLIPLGAMLAPVSAHAADGAKAFEGPRIAALAGLDRTDLAPGQGAQDAVLYGAQIGYDRAFGAFLLGAEADIVGSDAKATYAGFSSKADRYITVAARAGFALTPQLLGFARAGYGHARFRFNNGGGYSGGGLTLGGGGELAITRRLFVRAEYRFSNYGGGLKGQQGVAGFGIRF